MTKLIAYGENGVTNKLLESFIEDRENFKRFIKGIYWGGTLQKEKRPDLAEGLESVIEQPSFGRSKGKGEPDGLIVGKNIILLETKLNKINVFYSGDGKKITKKSEILKNYIDICRGLFSKRWFPKNYKGNKFIIENIINKVRKTYNKWYLVLLTDGTWEESKKLFVDLVTGLKKSKNISEKHVGWVSLDVVKTINYEPLRDALKVNGKL